MSPTIPDGAPELSEFALPRWAHVPGETEGADEPLLTAAKATLDSDLSVDAAHPALRYGLQLHEAGFWWEAHEVLEAVWKKVPPNSREKRLLEAVIQLSNAALKTRMARRAAAVRLLDEVLALLEEAAAGSVPARCLGIDTEQLAQRAHAARVALTEAPPSEPISAFISLRS